MARAKTRSVLSGMRVKEAMRRQVIESSKDRTIGNCINKMIKYKINSVLVTDDKLHPMGVVTKTDIMGAFYAMLTIDTAIENIYVSPLLYCFPDDELEASLDLMQENSAHRLYVIGAESNEIIGILAYSDIVGLLYRYCRACIKSDAGEAIQQQSVKNVMTPSVTHYHEDDPLEEIIEGLSSYRFGAVLIRNSQGNPAGVISKTDLIISYNHGVGLNTKAREIMNSPVRSCDESSLLTHALQQMLLNDVQRLFVHASPSSNIVGIVSLSDAARFRAGSCRACIAGRIMTMP